MMDEARVPVPSITSVAMPFANRWCGWWLDEAGRKSKKRKQESPKGEISSP